MTSSVFVVYGSTGQQRECVTGTGSTDHDGLAKVLEVNVEVAPHRGLETAKGTSNGGMTLQFPNMKLFTYRWTYGPGGCNAAISGDATF